MGKPDSMLSPCILDAAERTRGSETSQYPEEKKSTEISSVAASERERAQKSVMFQWNAVGKARVQGDTPVHERA